MTNFEFYKYEHFRWYNYPLTLKSCIHCPYYLSGNNTCVNDEIEKDSKECTAHFNKWATTEGEFIYGGDEGD
jgi:hypothetical protein